ncbi:hypothetical protein L6164_034323 [Bauhinia variegata]|uniref:Uncharacterized protein n=1 Tax=Bauhinia variegata TaxID=167791 RepID=A0ACB9KUV8_BAUVA|nr:hypothetical protein L6164_034323 [Bauhinia variegata]
MGSATVTRFFILLTTPFPFFRHRCPSLLRNRNFLLPSFSHFHHLTCSPTNSPHPLSSSLKASQNLHNQAASSLRTDYLGASENWSSSAPHYSHPWPEWLRFIDNLSAAGYFNQQQGIGGADEFVAVGELTEEFLREARACLAFARDRKNLLRLLSRRDIEVVVEHGAPFLFQNAEDSVRKMKSFLATSETTVLDADRARTVDLMKFMLSYTSNPLASSEWNNLPNRDLVESSVRNLFAELFKLSYNAPGSNLSGSVQNQMSGGFGQTRAPGQKIEMKRGDWLCPRCNFMNFARNIKCLECEEARPKRQLTGGEWECPQCDFFNYGRNMTCLRCDCKRPGQVPSSAPTNMSGGGYGSGSITSSSDVDSRLAANEEKAQRWFSKVSQLDNASDINNVIADEDFPEIMPLRKGVNRFVVSTRKTPLERRLADAQYRRNFGNGGNPEVNDFQAGDSKVSPNLDEILGRPTGLTQSDNNSIAAGRDIRTDNTPSISSGSSEQYRDMKGSNSRDVPFVPFPPDIFAQKSENLKTEENEKVALDTDAGSPDSGGNSHLSIRSASQIVGQDKEKEQAEKSERWFKKVAELHNVSDLTSAISDEDFPEIMPMRKGENRFVVSKKKDRSLTSPAYKRRLATEQAGNTDFVPFVPFPPGYFAKKDKQQSDGSNSTDKANIESSSASQASEKVPEISDDASFGLQRQDRAEEIGTQDARLENWSSKSPGHSSSDDNVGAIYGARTSGNSSPSDVSSQIEGLENKYSRNLSKEDMPSLTGNSSLASENKNVREQWTGKSLEGSAVKEPDPLDMSEEAKAERWFRRVAQIKDISELSQIPDEDFPSIMPMRKGVNRFVVSKRKTPLERRLTSQQYRRNLPVVSSDPIKKENEGS